MWCYVTPRKLRRILKFIQKRKMEVQIIYEYNNSLNMNHVRKYTGIIESYDVKNDEYEYQMHIKFTNGTSMEEYIGPEWYFVHNRKLNGAEMTVCNSGPYCYFIIKLKEEI